MSDVRIGAGLRADGTTLVGYPPGRAVTTGFELGADAQLRSGTVLYLGSRIGDRFETGHNVVIREECVIADDVSVWSNTVIDYGCRIGNRVKIHSNCYVAQFTEIEDDAFLAPGVTIANDLYPGNPTSARLMCGPWIGPRVQIGLNATILPYVQIGAGSLIGAGSVVALDIPPGCVAFGNPAVVRGRLEDLEPIDRRVEALAGVARRNRRAWSKPVTALHARTPT
jgi:acetyltransferase-like isoleucine patch superfamily enzyme